VICWVLGEYGTADGTHSAEDIIGKLCDVAEARPGDTILKVRHFSILVLWVSWLGRNVCPVGQSLAISCQFVHDHELARCAASISKVIEVYFVNDSHSELGDIVRGMQLQQSPKYVHMKSAKADKLNSFLRWQLYPSSLNLKCHS